MTAPLIVEYPMPGMVLWPTSNAAAQVQGHALFVFFARPDEGVMAWDISQPDEDILFPVLVRRFHLENITEPMADKTRELLNGGPSTLKPGRERDFFILYDRRPEVTGSHVINEQFSHSVLGTGTKHLQTLEDLRLTRCLIMRGFMGFDAPVFQDQLNAGWWRMIHVEPDDIFDRSTEERMERLTARLRLN